MDKLTISWSRLLLSVDERSWSTLENLTHNASEWVNVAKASYTQEKGLCNNIRSGPSAYLYLYGTGIRNDDLWIAHVYSSQIIRPKL